MKVLNFKEWSITETCQSSTKGIENDNAEPSYSYGNIKDILGNKYNYTLSSDKPLQEFEEEFLSVYKNSDIDMNDEYFAKSFIEYTKNQKRLTPPFQDDTITNNDFYAKSYYEDRNKLDENINNDILLWEKDDCGFEPQSIIDEDEEPNFYINGFYTKNYFNIIIYGENVSAHYSDKPYTTEVYKIKKSDVKKYVYDTTNAETADFMKYSNMSDEDKKDNIKVAYSLLELGIELIETFGFEYKNESRIKAHEIFSSINKMNEDGGVGNATGGNTSGMGAVVTSQPSSIPGDVAGATTGSGDVGSGFVNRNVRSRPKPRGASKTQKEKIVSSLKNMANSYSTKTDTYKRAGDKDATSMTPKNIKSFFDFSKS